MATEKSGSYKRVDVVQVYLWDQFVGAAALDPGYRYYAFAYDRKFAKSGIELSPLHLPLNANEHVFMFTELPEATYQRLPAMLADALPDAFGNALIDRYMADKGVSAQQITPLDRLAYMGDRAMGALEFRPQRGPRGAKSTAIEMNQLVGEARKAVAGRLDDDTHANAALRSIIEVGTSAGGARAKAVIAWNEATNEVRSGQVDAPPGFAHWLLKFDGMGKDSDLGASQDYGRIEYAYYLMAQKAGITMSPCRLLHENGRSHFMTRRFDREDGDHGNTKHHMQTLCAMAHLDFKKKATHGYSQLFLTIHHMKLGRDAMVEALRRMVFNLMARNCDDHTKNFSFLLRKDAASWELAPAYDLTFAYSPQSEWTHQHLMGINGKFDDFVLEDVMAEANRFGIGEARGIIKRVREAVKAWPDFAREAGVGETEIKHIQDLHLLLE